MSRYLWSCFRPDVNDYEFEMIPKSRGTTVDSPEDFS